MLEKMKASNSLSNNKYAAIRSIVSSSMGDKIAKDYGVEVYKTLTGFK
jgi:phosphomannomutase